MSDTRRRLVPASEPDADRACRLTAEDGRHRQTDTDKLFAQLAEQHETAAGNEFVFRGDPQALWSEVSSFVDEESQCCPFFTFEQIEQAEGVLLRATTGTT